VTWASQAHLRCMATHPASTSLAGDLPQVQTTGEAGTAQPLLVVRVPPAPGKAQGLTREEHRIPYVPQIVVAIDISAGRLACSAHVCVFVWVLSSFGSRSSILSTWPGRLVANACPLVGLQGWSASSRPPACWSWGASSACSQSWSACSCCYCLPCSLPLRLCQWRVCPTCLQGWLTCCV
jgi:hypothetical protein